MLVTGSSDGLGLAAARDLIARGHRVLLHARNEARAEQTRAAAPGALDVLVADAMSLTHIKRMAAEVMELGQLDAVIHNVGVGFGERQRIETIDGHAHVLQVNVLVPYLLSALLPRPTRAVWMSSGLHRDGRASVNDLDWNERPWNGFSAYADSKLLDAVLASACGRLCPHTWTNAVEPGWVATKMGGAGAPDDLSLAHVTQAWLADGSDTRTQSSGRYLFHQRPAQTHQAVNDPEFQNAVLSALAELTGTTLSA